MKARFFLPLLVAAVTATALLLCSCQHPKAPESGPAAPAPVAKAPEATGEGGDIPRGNGETIGVSLLTEQHVFYQDLKSAMLERALALNYKLAIVSSEMDAAKQDAQVDDFIVRKVAAIVLCPADTKSVVGTVKKANAAGIPVFTADIAAGGGDIVSHIASDNKQGGKLAGELIAKAVGGKGKVLIIDHPAVQSVQDRTAGFEEVMKNYPGIEIIKQPAEGRRDKAQEVTENMLSAHPDLKGIFGINDDSALGALAACRGHKGSENIVIIGYDGTPEARREISKGSQLKADVVQYPKRMGAKTIELIARYLAKQQVPKSAPIDVGVIDQESLKKEQASGTPQRPA